ncbi:AlpA family phage regulatory protein [Stenotrophomonas maltophilia]|uniref:helix-turn-helix transcriptional regulator n=1 Tax=Stenotrophomonas maltophilia TaxID=40324 RepID=UPI0030952C5E
MTDMNTTNTNAIPPNDALISVKRVEQDCGFSKTTIYRLMKRGQFPKPAKRTGRSVRWRNSEVQQWVRNEWAPQQS